MTSQSSQNSRPCPYVHFTEEDAATMQVKQGHNAHGAGYNLNPVSVCLTTPPKDLALTCNSDYFPHSFTYFPNTY